MEGKDPQTHPFIRNSSLTNRENNKNISTFSLYCTSNIVSVVTNEEINGASRAIHGSVLIVYHLLLPLPSSTLKKACLHTPLPPADSKPQIEAKKRRFRTKHLACVCVCVLCSFQLTISCSCSELFSSSSFHHQLTFTT